MFSPTDPDLIVVRGTFGLIRSEDGGESWAWICFPVMGATLNEDPAVAVRGDGVILAPVFDGLSRGVAGGCQWSFPADALTDVFVIDQAAHPTEPSTSWVVTSSGLDTNSVFRSEDAGASWTPTSEPIDPILFETIEVAPSDPSRLYLSGAYPPTADTPRRPFTYRSVDGGATWESFPFALQEGDRNLFLLAVDPTNPDQVFARVSGELDDRERLVRSADGGVSFEELLVVPDIAAFWVSPDGQTLLVGGIQGTGLRRSTDGGATFETVGEWEVSCITQRDGEIWLCGNNYADGFALAALEEDDTVRTLLTFDGVRDLTSCADEDDTTQICTPELTDLRNDLGLVAPGDGSPPSGCAVAPWGAPLSVAWLVLLCVGVGRRRHG